MANDLMIDLETLDTSPYCVILTIGIVRFDPYGEGIAEGWTLKPTIEDQTEQYNRIINDDTIFTLYITNYIHGFGYIRASATLVN